MFKCQVTSTKSKGILFQLETIQKPLIIVGENLHCDWLSKFSSRCLMSGSGCFIITKPLWLFVEVHFSKRQQVLHVSEENLSIVLL